MKFNTKVFTDDQGFELRVTERLKVSGHVTVDNAEKAIAYYSKAT